MEKRKINIEFIRIFAVFMVISIHVANVYIRRFGTVPDGDFLVSVIYSSFSRVCVPLFFMIGGAFALNKEYDGKKYFGKIIKAITVLIIWSVIYYLTKNGFHFEGIGKVIVNSFFNADMTSRHLWYMYPLIAIYIALPFLQNMCKNLSEKQENLFLILWFCFSGLSYIYIPLASHLAKSNIALEYPVPLINSAYYAGYFIAGHILYKRFKDVSFNKRKNIICIAIYLISTLVTILSTYFISKALDSFASPPTWYRGAVVIIASVAVFLLIVANADKFKSKFILTVSKHTFGIYLIHMIFLNIIKKIIVIADQPAAVAIPVITVIVFVCSLLSSMLLSKIPFIKKVIF
ncbi:MAG: acyltransferase family protein [Clostridia bacterium]|nr:acyltransferase family protein [Clostridia bacterium]